MNENIMDAYSSNSTSHVSSTSGFIPFHQQMHSAPNDLDDNDNISLDTESMQHHDEEQQR